MKVHSINAHIHKGQRIVSFNIAMMNLHIGVYGNYCMQSVTSLFVAEIILFLFHLQGQDLLNQVDKLPKPYLSRDDHWSSYLSQEVTNGSSYVLSGVARY